MKGGCPAASDISGGRYEGVTPRKKRHFRWQIRRRNAPGRKDISGGRYEGVTPPEEKTFPVAIRLGGTPVPIPNTKVKTQTADGTMLETAWESRRLPEPKGA